MTPHAFFAMCTISGISVSRRFSVLDSAYLVDDVAVGAGVVMRAVVESGDAWTTPLLAEAGGGAIGSTTACSGTIVSEGWRCSEPGEEGERFESRTTRK